MNPNRLIVAAAVLAGLAGALWWSNEQQDKPKPSPDDAPQIVAIPDADITAIEIRRMGADPVRLERSGGWKITAPKSLAADPDAASAITAALAGLTSERLVADSVTDLAPYGLKEPLLTVVVERAKGPIRLHFGDDTPSGGSTYVSLEGDKRLFLAPIATRSGFDKTWRDLRDKRLLPVDIDKATSITISSRGGQATFGRDTSKAWAILGPKPGRADNFAVEELVRKLKEARMEVTNDTEAEAALPTRFATAGPVATATINGPNATIEVRKAPDGTYLARSTAIDGVFTTTAELGDELAKDPASFRNRKLFDFGFSEPVSFEIKQDGKAFQFEKRGANWTRNGQPVDAASAQQLIDRLRELTANGFASSAAGSVVGEYSVTVSGKPEVVTLTRQGSAVFATRAGSPDVYTMEPSTLTEIATQAAEAKPPQPPASK